jgi:hypothetical protein
MYDQQDLKAILARAVEIQNRSKGSDPASGTYEKLSLEEIEEIARESGLSPEYVRQAAIELEGIPIEEPFFLDTGNNHEVELMGFASGKLDQKTWAELRSIIEYEFDSPGKVQRRPDGIFWKATPPGIIKFIGTRNSPTVEVKSSGNRSSILIKKSLKTYNMLLYPAYAALAGAVMIFTIMIRSGHPDAIIAIAALLGLSKLFFAWCDNRKKKAKEKLIETMSQLQTIITRRFTASRKETSSDKQVAVDLDESEDPSFDRDMNNPAKERTR